MRALFPLVVVLVLALTACSGDDDSGADTDTDGGCSAVTEGAWNLDGTCIGMPMDGTLTLESDGCSFTLSEWSMSMDMPAGGTVSGSDVTLTGAGWESCTGTTDGTTMSGTCDGGCIWDGTAL